MRKRKLLSAIIALTLSIGMLAGCGAKKEEGATGKSKELVVWSHLTKDEVEAFQVEADKWGKENNVKVKVVEDKGEFQALIQAANSPQGPDIMLGYPHDNLGTFKKAGIIADVPEDKIKKDNYANEGVIEAVTLDGKIAGYPLAQETVGLFYNKKLVSEVPESMEKLAEIGKEKGFMFNATDFYLAFGMIAANGGYVYKNNDGTLDPKDIGMGNEGAIKGYEYLKSLVDNKLIGSDINDDIAKGEFMGGKTAFYISGPWNVSAAKDAKLDFGIAPLPTLGGKETPSFLGVQTGFVSEKSDDKELAFSLLQHFAEDCGNIVYEKGNRIPATKVALESEQVKGNEYIQGFVKQTEKAIPMPNIPEVQAMWTPAADNLKLLLSGKIDPKKCGEEITKQIKQGIEQQK